MAWQIYELTNSPLQLGLPGLTRGAPMLVLLLFGGMLADAMNRRHLDDGDADWPNVCLVESGADDPFGGGSLHRFCIRPACLSYQARWSSRRAPRSFRTLCRATIYPTRLP